MDNNKATLLCLNGPTVCCVEKSEHWYCGVLTWRMVRVVTSAANRLIGEVVQSVVG